MSVIIETSIGDITVDLYIYKRPRCCLNFLKLCKIKYYNFSLFHTVQRDLVAQTGDPTASGRGGDSIFVKIYGEQARFFEMEVSPRIKHTRKGFISMVNNGSDMHGSQFFFTLADNLDYLDGKHTVFGEVTEGFDVLEKLNNTFCDEDNRPFQDIRIYHTIVLDDPYDDTDGLEVPSMSPGPTEEMLNSHHIACDANIDEDKDKTEAELAEMMAEKEAKANTQILEMVGDLPVADVAPPENVLFVCKLNPVTTAEDLEIIFSRFGPIVSCDVIKDSKTGESLQYAFIEFTNPDHCENAYFKMDNVLIDDRRIHVDFSQSVSKLKWKGKGKGVEIMSTGDAPIYVLKSQQRGNEQYDLVYEHDDADTDKDKNTESRKRKGLPDNANRNRHKKRNSQSPVHRSIKEQTRGRQKYSEEVRSVGDYLVDREDRTRKEHEFQIGKSDRSRERNRQKMERDVNQRRRSRSYEDDKRMKRTEGNGRKKSVERKQTRGKNDTAENAHKKRRSTAQSDSDNEVRENRKYNRNNHRTDMHSDSSEDDKYKEKKKKKKKHSKHKKQRYSSD